MNTLQQVHQAPPGHRQPDPPSQPHAWHVMKPTGQPQACQQPPAAAQRVNYEPQTMNTLQQTHQAPPGHRQPAPPGQSHAWHDEYTVNPSRSRPAPLTREQKLERLEQEVREIAMIVGDAAGKMEFLKRVLGPLQPQPQGGQQGGAGRHPNPPNRGPATDPPQPTAATHKVTGKEQTVHALQQTGQHAPPYQPRAPYEGYPADSHQCYPAPLTRNQRRKRRREKERENADPAKSQLRQTMGGLRNMSGLSVWVCK